MKPWVLKVFGFGSFGCLSRQGRGGIFFMDAFILLFFLIFFGLVSAFSGSEMGYDFANYHFYNGYAFLQGRVFNDIAPAGAWSFFNPLLDAVNYVLIQNFSGYWASFWMGALSGFLGFFTYKLCKEVFGLENKFALYGSLILALSSPAVFHMVGSTHGDLNSSIFIMMALWLWVKFLKNLKNNKKNNHKINLKPVIFIGLCVGIGVGLKLTQVPFGIGIFISFFALWIFNGKVWPVLGFLLGGLLGFLITDGWWMGLLYGHYGNPVFPFFNQIFHSPYFSDVSLTDPTFRADTWFKLLWLPFSLGSLNNHVNEGVILDFRLIGCFLLGLIFYGICFFKRKNLQAAQKDLIFISAFLSVFFLSSYVIWAFLFGIYRYAVPMQLVAGILCVGFLEYFLRCIKDYAERLGVFIIVLGFMVFFTVPTVEGLRPVGSGMPYVYILPEAYKNLGKNLDKNLINKSMIILTSKDQILKAGDSFVLPLLNPKIAVSPNFNNFNNFNFDFNKSEGALWLKTGGPKNLSMNLSANKILNYQGPIFLLVRVDMPQAMQPKTPLNLSKEGGVELVSVRRKCQLFETSVVWAGKFALCEVTVKRRPR